MFLILVYYFLVLYLFFFVSAAPFTSSTFQLFLQVQLLPWPDARQAAPALAAGESLKRGGKKAAEPGKNRTGGKSAHEAGKTLLLKLTGATALHKKAGMTSKAAAPQTFFGKTQGGGKAAEPLLTQVQPLKESEEKKNGSWILKSCAALGQAP